jgi:signal transduction histidine kinase
VLIRLTPAGGGVGISRALLDGVYTAILGGAALVLIVVLRRAAADVDAAQATAVRRYSRAIREHATEVERVQVDAIVHDSVLTTLLSAARADTIEAKTLSARMARNAIDHLDAAASDGPGSTVPPVPLVELRQRITAAVSALAAPVDVHGGPLGSRTVPAAVADAMASAALQAAVNSVQHAGAGVSRWVVVRQERDAVTVEIGDDGTGFDMSSIPAERLGVRRSIVERVAAAGGVADVRTAPGAGTTVVLTWSAAKETSE